MITTRAISTGAMAFAALLAGVALTTTAWADGGFANGTSAAGTLDLRTGTRIAAASETINYSPRYGYTGGSAAVPGSCTVKVDGTTIKSATAADSVAWSPAGVGRHTLTHTAGGETLLAAFAVLGEDSIAVDCDRLPSTATWTSNRVYVVTRPMTVPSGVVLTIEPGTIVKFLSGASLIVASGGTCTAKGVIFTHINDDSVGGDTLFDSDETNPVSGAYEVNGNVIDDDATEYRYAPPQTLTANISGMVNLRGYRVYIASNSVTVALGATLNLNPGTVIKFASGCSMTVNGTLNAQGTRAAPIVFTSLKDDEWGGDTNGDGEKTVAQAGDWEEITNYGNVKLYYCNLLWGGYGYYSNKGDAILRNSGGTVDLESCTIAGSNLRLLYCASGQITAKNCILRDGRWGMTGSGISFINGIIADCSTAAEGGTVYNTVIDQCATSSSGATIKYCLIHDSGSAVGDGNIVGDPLFFDPDNGDFRISAASPCVDAGDGTVAPATDYYGSPRMDVKKIKDTGVPNRDGVCPDIGIYEVPGTAAVPLPDLAVMSVMAPATAMAGENIEVVYTVTNRGAAAAMGRVRDAVKFRGAEAMLGGQEVSAGEVEQGYDLAAGAAASFTARVTVPALKAGKWKVGVESNGSRDVYEQNLANNSGWTTVMTEIALPGLAMGDNALTVEAGTSVARALTGLPAAGGVVRVTGSNLDRLAVFGGNGTIPTAAANDSPGIRLDDGSWLVVLPKRGVGEVAYLAIDNGGAETTVKVTVEETKLALYGASPKEIANTGSAALTITGSGLTAASAVTVGGRAATVEVLNAAQILVMFDATGMSVGAASVVVSEGGKTASLDGMLAIYKPKAGAKLEASLELPSSVRDGRVFTAYVVYANTGDEPMTMPLFKVESASASTKLGLVASESMSETKVFVGGISPTAPAGVLKPGDSGRIPVFFQPFGSYSLKLTHVTDDEKVGAFPAFGGVAEYKAAMSAAATRLNLRGRTSYNVHDFVDQAIWEKNNIPCAAVSGHLRDVRTKKPITDVTIALMTTNGAAATAKTDANGYFQLANLADGGYLWRVENGCELADVSTNGVTVAALVDLNGCEVLVTPGGRISGHVSGVDGMVLSGATLALCDGDGGQLAVTVSDDNGCFAFTGLSAGTNRVTCGAIDGYVGSVSGEIVLDEVNGSAQVEFELTKGATICGMVTFAGVAVTNGNVQAITADGVAVEVMCDENGGYAFDGLPAGKYAVRYYSTDAYSEDVTVELAVGDARQVDLMAVERPLFVPTAKMGFEQLTTRFVFTDRGRMTNVVDWAWDFDSDGVVDSTSDSPTWTYSQVGTNTVTLKITEYGGKVTESRYLDCCIVEAKLATIYKSNAVVFGYNQGTLSVVSVGSTTLALTGDPAKGTLEPGMVIMGNKGDDYFVRRVVSATKNGSEWILTTENADWFDVYEQYTESFVGEIESAAKQPVKSASSARMRFLTASPAPVKMFAEGGVSFSISAQPDLRLEIVRKVQNGKKYERTALVGALKLGGSIGLEGNVGVKWKKTQKLPFTIETPPFWGITVAPIAEVYAEAQASVKGELGVEGSIEGAIVIGMEKNGYEDAHWLPPLSFTPSGTVKANIEGNGHFKFGVNPGVKVSFIKTTDIKLALDGYAKFEVKAGTQTPAEVSLTAGVDLTGEVNLIDWELPWVDVKVNLVSGTLEGPKAQFFRWTGPDPDFSWKPSGELTSPCQIQLVDESTGDVIRWFGRQYEYSVKAHEWEFPDGGTIYSGMESAPYFSQDGKYRVGLHAIGNYVTGPCKKWQTVVVGKPEETSDDGNYQQDAQGGGTPAKSCDPNAVAGPEGVGERRLVKPGEWLDYTIYFENKEGFDIADAQEVRVTNKLDEHLDWSTFEMGEIAFGSNTDLGLDGKCAGTSEAAYNGTARKVRTELAVGEDGVASWYMRIVDSEGVFGWPNDGSGFLPSNDDTHRGEGHLTYRIRVRDDAPYGVVITNSATIVFDYNDPIDTDPSWWNTVGEFRTLSLSLEDEGLTNLTLVAGEVFGVLPTPKRDGYAFKGWFFGPDGTGGEVTAGMLVPNGLNNIYAKWEKLGGETPSPVDPTPVDPTPVDPTPVDPPVDPTPRVIGEVAGVPQVEKAAVTYEGYLVDADDAVVGTIGVKAAKSKTDKKSGRTTSKLTIGVQLVGVTKKVSISGEYDLNAGGAQAFAKDGYMVTLTLGANGMIGSCNGYEIEGVVNVFAAKDAASKAAVSDADAAYVGVYNLMADEGVFTITVAKKGKVKIAGTNAAGKKVNATAQLLVGEDAACIPVVVPKLGLSFAVWFERGSGAVSAKGLNGAIIGKAGTLVSGAAFRIDGAAVAELIGDATYAEYLPTEVAVVQNGAKWVVAPEASGKAAKAGKVALDKSGAVDKTKLGANPSALKLTYTAKTGSFKGSFKAYANVNGKPKAISVTVNGVLIDGIGYGTASIKNGGSVGLRLR